MSHEQELFDETYEIANKLFLAADAKDAEIERNKFQRGFTHHLQIIHNYSEMYTLKEEVEALEYLLQQKESGNLTPEQGQQFELGFIEYHTKVVINFTGNYSNKMRKTSRSVLMSMLEDKNLDLKTKESIQKVINLNPGCNFLPDFIARWL